MVWKFDLAGNLLDSKDLGVEGMQQGTKVSQLCVRNWPVSAAGGFFGGRVGEKPLGFFGRVW